MIAFDWRDHIENAISCYISSICNGKYTEENLIQCCIDLCGHIDTRTDEIWIIGASPINKIDVVGRFDFEY